MTPLRCALALACLGSLAACDPNSSRDRLGEAALAEINGDAVAQCIQTTIYKGTEFDRSRQCQWQVGPSRVVTVHESPVGSVRRISVLLSIDSSAWRLVHDSIVASMSQRGTPPVVCDEEHVGRRAMWPFNGYWAELISYPGPTAELVYRRGDLLSPC